jgi:hypothetical protein
MIYLNKIERVLLREEAKKKRGIKEAKIKADLKMNFFSDILKNSFPGDSHVWDKLEKRKEMLEKAGYFKNGEITELGIKKLIAHTVNLVKNEQRR